MSSVSEHEVEKGGGLKVISKLGNQKNTSDRRGGLYGLLAGR